MSGFPTIPGVSFRHIAGFENYAVSSDGRVWNGANGKWRLMHPFVIEDGESAVHLEKSQRGPMDGIIRCRVKELIEAAFGKPRA